MQVMALAAEGLQKQDYKTRTLELPLPTEKVLGVGL